MEKKRKRKCDGCAKLIGEEDFATYCDACGDLVCESCADDHALDTEELYGICGP